MRYAGPKFSLEVRRRSLCWIVLGCLVALPVVAQSQATDEEAVIQVVEDLFSAMRARDAVAIEQVMVSEAFVIGLSGGNPSRSTRDDFARGIAGLSVEVIERMWDPDVQIEGRLAQLWASYDFYIDGEFSHCGVDAFHVVKTDAGWRVAGITYTRVQPPSCVMHPDGPPR